MARHCPLRRPRSGLKRYALPIGGALAASLAAVLLLGPKTDAPVQDGLSLALETAPAMGSAKLADGPVVQPTLTVRAANGEWCREYRVGDAVGLACREGGRWKVEAEGAGAGPAQDPGISLASGADGSSLDEAYRRLGASDPLAAQEEAKLIREGWR